MSAALAGRLAAAVLLGGVTGIAAAHHSFAQFDTSRTVELSGTLRALEWQNPHSWIWIDVPEPGGMVATWGGEFAGGPSNLSREGIDRTTIQPGDKIVLTLYPAKSGSKAGSVSKLQLANGKVIEFQRPQTNPPANPPPS